jgi:hypothetical protein
MPGPSEPKPLGHLSLFVQNDTSTSTFFLPGPVLVACLSSPIACLSFSPIARGRNSLLFPGTSIAAAAARGNPTPAPHPPSYHPRAAPSRFEARERSQSPSRLQIPIREEAGPALQMEPAAARKEWRVVPDTPLRSNGAEVPSWPHFSSAA